MNPTEQIREAEEALYKAGAMLIRSRKHNYGESISAAIAAIKGERS